MSTSAAVHTSEKVLELVVFKLLDGVDRDRFMTTVPAVSSWIADQPGFISRELSYDAEGDRWVEVVWWRSLAEAHAASELAMSSEACAPMFAAIEMESALMLHGELVASAGAAVAA